MEQVKKEKRIRARHFIMGSGVALLLACLFVVVLYIIPVSGFTLGIIKGLHMPIGKVGSDYVRVSDISVVTNSTITSETITAHFNTYAGEAKLREITKKYQMRKMLGVIANPTETGEPTETDVIKIWWNGNSKVNARFAQMESLQARINRGGTFAGIASQYSEDPATKDFGGDAGFVSLQDLYDATPEFADGVGRMQKGDEKIIPTRYGLELVYIEDVLPKEGKGSTLFHIHHILLKEQGFDAWLAAEKAKVPVKMYIKI